MNQAPQTGFFGQPAGLRTLFFAEMWERFSYYGMRAILVLFMTAPIAAGGFGWTPAKAGPVYGVYTSMVYLLALPGGWIADRVLGARKSVFWGGVIIMLGHISLAVPSINSFYLGLVLIVIGVGLLKPNISTMVGQLYAPEDERRDAGFSIFYMGINLGAMISPLVVGYLAQSEGWRATLSSWGIRPETSWHWGFGATAVGMFLGLIWYVVDRKSLGEAGLHPAVTSPEDAVIAKRKLWRSLTGVAAALVIVCGLQAAGVIALTTTSVSNIFGVGLLVLVVVFFAWLFLSANWTPEERRRLVVILVLFLGAAVFWSVFEQAGSTLTLFAQNSTRNSVFGHEFPSSWWQSINSGWIVVLAPVFAWIWVWLGRRNPSSPAKFAIGLLLVALSFYIMVPAAVLANGGHRVGWWWLMSSYFLATAGELSLSPVGLSAMTRLAPKRVASLMMGVWFLADSVGNFIGGRVAGVYEKFSLPTLFGGVATYALIFAVILALLVNPIKRMLAQSETAG
ncbi:MAG TPA: peptide MFS transporter [Gemmatimonadales bacterium]